MRLSFSSLIPRLPLFLFPLFLLGCWLWLGPLLPYHYDVLEYIYPERFLNNEILLSGRIPLWNPNLGCGIPHLANWQSGLFYPPYWIMTAVGIGRGLVLLAVFHELWAFVGFYLWVRRQGLSPLIGSLCAWTFAGSAHFTLLWENLPLLATASWIPWVFWAAPYSPEKPSFSKTLLWTLILSLQLMAGYPYFAFYTWILLAIWGLFGPSLSRKALLGATFMALILTMVQWLPFLEFLTFSTHGNWSDWPYRLHSWELLTLFSPTILGIPGVDGYKSHPANAFFGNLYFGILPFLAWIMGLLFPRQPRRFWGWASLGILLWMALPSLDPGGVFSRKLFGFLNPSKAVGLFLFTACTLSAHYLQSISRFFESRRWMAWGLCLFWVFDLLTLPFLLIYRIPNGYLDGELQSAAATLREKTGHQRFLSMQLDSRLKLGSSRIDDEFEARLSMNFLKNFLPNTHVPWGLRSAGAYTSLTPDNYQNLDRYFSKGFPYKGDLLDVAGVRVLLLPQTLPRGKYEAAGKLFGNTIHLNPLASEDMRWAPRMRMFENRPAVLERLARPGNPWREFIYLDQDTEGHPICLKAEPGLAESRMESGVDNDDFSRRSFQGLFPKRGFLAFNESFTPGWHAWLDGLPVPILRAYGLFMAAAVPSGNHFLEFRYDPASFRLGLFISLCALAALGGGAGFYGWRRLARH